MAIFSDVSGPKTERSPVSPGKPLVMPNDIRKLREMGDDRSVAARAYELDQSFRELVDHVYQENEVRPMRKENFDRLPTLLLNMHYTGQWEENTADDLTAEISKPRTETTPFETVGSAGQSLGDPSTFAERLQAAIPTSEFAKTIQSPTAVASGLIGKGLEKLGVPGAGDVSSAQELPENLKRAGKFVRTAAPIGAAIASGGMSIPAQVAATGSAGAIGELAQQSLEAASGEEKSARDFSVEPLKAGAVDATIDLATLGALRLFGSGRKFISEKLKEGARESVRKVLAPTKEVTKRTTEKITGEILERPFGETAALTTRGMEAKAAAAKELAGEAIGEAGELAGKTPVSSVVDALESQKSKFMAGGKAVDQTAIDQITEVQEIFAQYGDFIDDNVLRDVNRIFGGKVAASKGFQKTLKEGTELDVLKTASRRIRNVLAEAHPDIAVLNKEYNFWSDLEGVLKATNERKIGQQGFMRQLAGLGGAASGDNATDSAARFVLFRMLHTAFTSPAWRLASAKLKSNIAESLLSGNIAQTMSLVSKVARPSAQLVTSPKK